MLPCENVLASAVGLVGPDGTTIDRGVIEYEIEQSTTTISLVNVAIYCVHTRTQNFESATITHHDGSTSALDESQLSNYGININ